MSNIDLQTIEIDDVNSINDYINKVTAISYSRSTVQSAITGLLNRVHEWKTELEILEYALKTMKPVLNSNEQQDLDLRTRIADIYENQENYHSAASILEGSIFLPKEHSSLTNDIKFQIFIRILRLYLEANEPENASSIITNVQYLRSTLENVDSALDIHFKLSQARVYDSLRQFLQAASKYYQVSRETEVEENDRMECLKHAIICGVLGPAGPQRSSTLRMLYNDERSKTLPLYQILEKAYLEQLFSGHDADDFATYCSPHQLTGLSDGTTVLTRALIDHNVLSLSKLYKNVDIETLSKLLDLPNAEKAESYVAKMISENRLHAKIDDVGHCIYFQSNLDQRPDNGTGRTIPLTADFNSASSHYLQALQQDARLDGILTQLNSITDSLVNE